MSDDVLRNDLVKTFQRFDTDGNNRIDRQEFDGLLDALGSKMSKDDRDTGFVMLDQDDDGSVTLEELSKWWDVVREEGRS